MIIAVCVLAAALIVITVLWYRTNSRSLLAAHERKTVIVTLKTDEAFQGALYATAPDAITLRGVTALAVGATSEHHPVDGELLILRADVAYMQFV